MTSYKIKKMVGLLSYLLKINNEFSDEIKLSLLKKQKRFQGGFIKLLEYQLYYVDSASLYSQYIEIVKNDIYAFSKKIKPKYIIDCGANIGLSVNFKNIKCIQSALWNKDDFIELNSINSDASSITQEIPNANKIKVRTESLKKYINKTVDFLKIDIEGAEYEVLIDIEERLDQVKNIFIEYHCDDLSNKKFNRIIQILTKAGFKYYILPESVPNSPFKYKNIKKNYNYHINLRS